MIETNRLIIRAFRDEDADALAYDRLAKEFYPKYKERSSTLFEIWDYYHKNRA